MAVPSINPALRTENLLSPILKNSKKSFLDKIEEFIKSQEARCFSNEEAIEIFDSLMAESFNSEDIEIFQFREGLCCLLQINIGEIRTKVLTHLKAFIDLSSLAYDVLNNQSQNLIKLEKDISNIIASNIHINSSEFFILILEIYRDILERLWILPDLVEERSCYAAIVEENGSSIVNTANLWLKILNQHNFNHENLRKYLKTTPVMLQRIVDRPFITTKKTAQLKLLLKMNAFLEPTHASILILATLGNIYQEIDDIHKAADCYLEALRLINSYKIEEMSLKKTECAVLCQMGMVYNFLGNYQQGIDCCKKSLQIAESIGDVNAKSGAYAGLGTAYDSLGEYTEAIKYHEQDLQAAKCLKDSAAQGESYGNLANTYRALGDYSKAIEYHKKDLEIASVLQNQKGVARAFINLGNTYNFAGEYLKAIDCYEKSLQIVKPLHLPSREARIYLGFGNLYCSLGEYSRAIEYFNKALSIFESLMYEIEISKICSNLGVCYVFLKESRKAVEYYSRSLKLAESNKEPGQKSIAYGGLGSAYYSMKEYAQAIENYEKQGQIAFEIKDPKGESAAYANLGSLYRVLEDYTKALEYHYKSLEISKNLGAKSQIASVFNNIGIVYQCLNDFKKSEEYFRESIRFFSELQDDLQDHHQWKITTFEEQAWPYIGLETVLLKQGKKEEALEVADSRRSRAISSALSRKLERKTLPSILLKTQEMQQLAQQLGTNFVVYSLSNQDREGAGVWIISSQGNIDFQSIPVDKLSEDMKDAAKMTQSFPYKISPPKLMLDDEAVLSEEEAFNERLSQWYDVLVRPIKDYLPKDPQQTVTFIPEGFLSQIPFAALRDTRDKKGKYLIEKHPISIAPSIKVLELLNQLPKPTSEDSLIVGHPITPNLSDNDLEFAEKQALHIVAPFLNTSKDKILTKANPTANRVVKEMTNSRWIHLSCHGTLGNILEEKSDPHSVFEGLFKLAADENHSKGYLQSQEIAFLNLQADLVFMNACFSGRGKLQQEGTIGPVWSFLAAGARSTIGTYWGLLDTELTNQIVEVFYKHLLGKGAEKLNKAQALQKAMLYGIKKDRNNPRQWAAFFLSGLSD